MILILVYISVHFVLCQRWILQPHRKDSGTTSIRLQTFNAASGILLSQRRELNPCLPAGRRDLGHGPECYEQTNRKFNISISFEPTTGIEPVTSSLPRKRSTPELRRLDGFQGFTFMSFRLNTITLTKSANANLFLVISGISGILPP